MRLWSRGLGKSNLGIDFRKVQVLTLGEALDVMPQQAADQLAKHISTNNVIAVSGKVLPPTGWEFVIVFERADLLTLLVKLLFSRKITKLVFGDGEVEKHIRVRDDVSSKRSAMES